MVHIHLQLTNCHFVVVEEGARKSSFFVLNEKALNLLHGRNFSLRDDSLLRRQIVTLRDQSN